MKKELSKTVIIAIATSTILLTRSAIAGSNFTISPTPGKTFPTLVNQGAVVSAYYTITNNTHSIRSGYRVQGLPATVIQNTSDPANCATVITLTSQASCILQLDISGEVHSSFALCKGASCTSASVLLNVSRTGNTPGQNINLIAGGTYNNTLGIRYPFVAKSTDGGAHWNYILDSSNTSIPADFNTISNFNQPICNGANCIFSGQYTTNGMSNKPLLASSQDGGTTWTYTITSTTPALPGDFISDGILYNGSCSGHNCIAGGTYYNGTNYFPLIALSTDCKYGPGLYL